MWDSKVFDCLIQGHFDHLFLAKTLLDHLIKSRLQVHQLMICYCLPLDLCCNLLLVVQYVTCLRRSGSHCLNLKQAKYIVPIYRIEGYSPKV